MVDMNEIQVSRAVVLREQGWTYRQIAADLNFSVSVIYRAIKRHRETGLYKRRQGQGKKRKTTRNQDRFLVISALRRRTSTASDLQNELRMADGVEISDQTVRNRLREHNLRARRPMRALRLQIHHRQARLRFGLEHVNWQLRHWRRTLFTDESRFSLTSCDGRVRVWRRPGERTDRPNILEYDRSGLGSVMVWGGISLESRTELLIVQGPLNAVRYVQDILAQEVVPAAERMGPDFLLMHDNARAHVAEFTINFLEDRGIAVMNWPAISPDLNPIEHLWDMLERRIRKRLRVPQNLQGLADALVEEWRNIPQQDIRKLVRSMPHRCQSVIDAHGGHTRY